MANSYPFPLLEVNELIQQYRQELPELNISQTDFASPKLERWQTVYTMLLEILTDTPPDRVLTPSLEIMSNIQYPELYEDALPLFTLALCMQRVMCACGIEDFNLRDITDPKPKRLQRNMSAILNFLFFRSERLEFYDGLKAEHAAQLKMRESLIKQNMDLKAEINRIRSERAIQEPQIKELDEKNAELEKHLETMTEVTTQKKKEVSERNTRIAEKKARMADLKARVAVAKEEGARLSKQIVQSPQRMKENMGRMAKQLEQLRLVKEQRNARVMELKQMKENLEQVKAACDLALDLTTKITSEMSEQKEKQREIQAMRDKVVEKREELHDLETKEQQLNRMIAGKQEKLSKMSLTQANKKQSHENTLQLLKEEQDILSMRQSEDAAQKDAVYQAMRELELNDQNYRARHEQLMGEMRAKYSSVLEQLDVYHGRLTESWNKVGSLA